MEVGRCGRGFWFLSWSWQKMHVARVIITSWQVQRYVVSGKEAHCCLTDSYEMAYGGLACIDCWWFLALSATCTFWE